MLLIAGAAVTGVFTPRVDGDWKDEGLVTSKEKATDYLIIDTPEGEEPVLRPLINTTSAQLLFGADVEATQVPEKELKTLEVGAPIGILNAPGSPPDAEDLINEGWTACTDAAAGHQGQRVRHRGDRAGARHRVPGQERGRLLRDRRGRAGRASPTRAPTATPCRSRARTGCPTPPSTC